MKILGNIIWLLFGGLITAIVWFILGLILCITIIGIPFGKQLFKISRLFLWPFGKDVDLDPGKHIIMNILWLLIIGPGTAISFLIFAVLCAITIIGIPFAVQWFKLMKVALLPFGAKIVNA